MRNVSNNLTAVTSFVNHWLPESLQLVESGVLRVE